METKGLLEFHACAGFFQLSFGFLSLFLGHGFLDGRRCTVNGTFGFLQAQASDLANCLDHVNFLVASAVQHQVELRSEEHTSELQSRPHLVCRLLLEKKKKTKHII